MKKEEDVVLTEEQYTKFLEDAMKYNVHSPKKYLFATQRMKDWLDKCFETGVDKFRRMLKKIQEQDEETSG